MTKLTLKDFFMVLGYVIAGGTALYSFGVRTANKQNNTTKIEEAVTEQKKSIDDLTITVLTLRTTVEDLRDTVSVNSRGQRINTGSIRSLALKVADSPSEFAKIMEGRTFEVVQDEPMKSVFPETKIKIMKIDSTKKR